MKARILSAKTPLGLVVEIDKLTDEDIAVRHVGYSIDPKGQHHALVLFTPGADRREDVGPAASRFIADALDPGTPGQKEVG